MAQTSRKRLPELDIARTLAICLIVGVHLYTTLASGPKAIRAPYSFSTADFQFFRTYLADLGLALFFFLSGFALYRNNQVFSTLHDAASFYRKRALRIYPLYWAALFFYVILYNILPLEALVAGYNPAGLAAFFPGLSISSILIYILGLQGLFIPPANNHIGGVWFVGAILIYYAIYPLIMAFSSRVTTFVAASSIVYLILLALQFLLHTVEPQLFIFYGVFVGGVLVSKYALADKAVNLLKGAERIALIPATGKAAAVSLTGLLCSLFFYPLMRVTATVYPSAATVWPLALANVFLLLFSVFVIIGIKMLIASRPYSSYRAYRLIAYSSYSIYLFHGSILLMMGLALMYRLTLTTLQVNVILIFVGLPSMFVICYFVQTLQDKAMKNVKGHIARRRMMRDTTDRALQ